MGAPSDVRNSDSTAGVGNPSGEGGASIEQERLSRAEAEAAQRRLAFAYEASKALFDGPLDVVKRLERLARISVPDLADWCFCDLVGPTTIDRVACAAWNPERADLVSTIMAVGARRPVSAIDRVLATGTPHVALDVSTPAALAELGAPFDTLGATSVLILPLRARGKVLGSVTFALAESNRHYRAVDLALASDLAQRAEVAIDNALLVSELERSVQMRDEVVGIVSHDLRNPVSTVAMAASLLQDGFIDDPAKARAKLGMISRAAKRMEALLRDLLDVTAIEGGGLTLEFGPHEARPIVADVFEIFQQAVAQKRVALKSDIANGPTLWCDRDRVIQVLSNLIGNAIRFTPEGGSVTVRITRDEDQRAFVVAVADTGAGIAADQLPHVFDRFYQGRRKAREGAGLGLSIVRGIVESHGGKVWVTSEVGRGATFTFTLPDKR